MSLYGYVPTSLNAFIGNQKIVEQVRIAIKAANKENRAMAHVLMTGPPGTGKTTLAKIIANELGSKVHYSLGATFDPEKVFYRIQEKDIVFIDEIHRMSMSTEESLYLPLEEFRWIPKAFEEANVTSPLPRFTLVGATTLLGNLSKPLRDRCSLVLQYEHYSLEDMIIIVSKVFESLQYSTSVKAIKIIAGASRFTPRTADLLTQRIIEYHLVKGRGKRITINHVKEMLKLMNIRENGLNNMDIDYLTLVANSQRAIGMKPLSTMLMTDERTITGTIEPFLTQTGFVILGARGREITTKGYELLKQEGVKLREPAIGKMIAFG
ncbi:MAG: Holliday junction DNA helicase RuvB C-terminal domain-containing protein [Phycisphaerae bacterium]|jgi:Holliday junction DNA helicase RuvB